MNVGQKPPLHKGAVGERIVTEGNPQGEHQRLPLLTKGSCHGRPPQGHD